MPNPAPSPSPIHVICIQWGTRYDASDINTLHSMVMRNTSLNVRFHLFSNEPPDGIPPGVEIHPEPGLDIPAGQNRFSYRKEAGLCDDNLGGLKGQRVFFFDLDVVITGNLDELFQYPKGDGLYIIKDWNTRGNHVGQASCYSFVVGTLGYIKADYEAAPLRMQARYGTASQEYLSAKVIERYGQLQFWPDQWFRSFRFHCLPHPILRWFKDAKRPDPDTKLIAFHGLPDVQGAIDGKWGQPGDGKYPRGWKKLYKHCRPTPWVLEYWK
jgi:hypothetical protein